MFQYDGKPRKKPSTVFASMREKPYALASSGHSSAHGAVAYSRPLMAGGTVHPSGTQTLDSGRTPASARPAAAPPPAGDAVDALYVGGVALLALAGAELVQALVFAIWFGLHAGV